MAEATVPKYRLLAAEMKRKVLAGEWREGERIPPERELEVMFEASRPTIGKALGQLVSEGLLMRRQGSGTFVCNPGIQGRLVRFLHYKYAGRNIDHSYNMEILQAVEERLARAGLRVLFSSAAAENTAPEPAECALVAVGPVGEEVLEQYRNTGRPVVLVDHEVSWADSVVVDNTDAARQCTAALIAEGHKRVCFVSDMRTPSREWPNSARRRAGYEAAMRAAGFAPRIVGTLRLGRLAEEVAKTGATAVFFSSTHAAGAFLAGFARNPGQRRFPVLAAFGAQHELRSLPPFFSLLLLSVDWRRMGELAADMLIRRLRGGRGHDCNDTVQRVSLRPRLLRMRQGAAGEDGKEHAQDG